MGNNKQRNKAVKRAQEAKRNFNARGSKCPCCGKSFRYGCEHSITDAHDRLQLNIILAATNN